LNNINGIKQKIKIEICCGSVDDVIAAASAGVHRIEFNSALELGGLTPSLGMMRLARETTDIGIISMLRPRGGGFWYSDKEFETMLIDVAMLLENGADGIAFGILTQSGELDDARTKIICDEITKYGKDKEAVFHMAFDEAATDEFEMLSRLDELGFARVLTKGRAENAMMGADALRRYVEYTQKRGLRLEILPGGSIRPFNAAEIVTKTGASQLHGKLHGNFGGEVDVVDSVALRGYLEWAEGC